MDRRKHDTGRSGPLIVQGREKWELSPKAKNILKGAGNVHRSVVFSESETQGLPQPTGSGHLLPKKHAVLELLRLLAPLWVLGLGLGQAEP